MKAIRLLLTALLLAATLAGKAQSVSIGEREFTPNPGAILDISSTSKGILIPRMTAAERHRIATSGENAGLLVYQTDGSDAGFYYWNGAIWKRIGEGVSVPDFAAVAVTGSYDDLSNKPTIPAGLAELSGDATHRTVSDDEKAAWGAKAETDTVTASAKGLMSAADKRKLDGMAENANSYMHPEVHPTSMITQDENNRFVTDNEKATWNAKSDFSGSYGDLSNKPTIPARLAELLGDVAHRTVSDEQIAAWSAKAENDTATTSASGLMSAADKAKLDGVAENANNYVYMHPESHPASMIAQDENNRFVSNAEKAAWSAKAETTTATSTASGLMSAADKAKLDGVAENANSYTHPEAHPASMITQDKDNRFVTDTEKAAWNAKSDFSGSYTDLTDKPFIPDHLRDLQQSESHTTVTRAEREAWNAKSDFSGSYTELTDKPKLATVATSGSYGDLSNKPTIPTRLAELSGDAAHRTVSDDEKAAWTAKAETTTATTSASGLMSAADKAKLDGVAENANNYVYMHPEAHPASIIVQDESSRFVSDTEKTTWNAKSDFSGSYGDLSNKPTIPARLAELSGDVAHRTVSDNEKAVWSSKAGNTTATASANGLMSAADKAKLDGVAENANNYVYTHPEAHPAGIITQDENNRFVTDTEKVAWSAKSDFSGKYEDLTDKPKFATVATSGRYEDLSNKPAIPTYGVVSAAANGLAPKLPGTGTKFLRGDGTWSMALPGWQTGSVSGANAPRVEFLSLGYAAIVSLGIAPTPNPSGAWSAVGVPTARDLHGACEGNGLWVAVGKGGISTSSDGGASWTQRSTKKLRKVAYGNGMWVAVGKEGIATSADGMAWTNRDGSGLGIAYGNGVWVRVGTQGSIATSTNGIAWTSRQSPTYNNINRVTYANGTFVASVNDGYVLRSADGSSWTMHGANVGGNNVYSATYGNGRWVAVGEMGYVSVSADNGASWQGRRVFDSKDHLRDITFAGGEFVLVGQSGSPGSSSELLYRSADGYSWSGLSSPKSTPSFNAVATSPMFAMALGSAGSITKSSFSAPAAGTYTISNLPGVAPYSFEYGSEMLYVRGAISGKTLQLKELRTTNIDASDYAVRIICSVPQPSN